MDATTASSSSSNNMLDALVRSFDNISSTQLYTLIVTLTVLVSFVLLGSSAGIPASYCNKPLLEENQSHHRSRTDSDDAPQVRWQIFTYVNYAIVAAFLAVGEFARQNTNSHQALLLFLMGWSILLGYFFGFFGVSFVHQNLLREQDLSSQKQQEPKSLDDPTGSSPSKASVPDRHLPQSKLHPPALSTPVCTDKVSVEKNTTSISRSEISGLPDEDICQLVLRGQLKDHELERMLTPRRAVVVRRLVFSHKLGSLKQDSDNNMSDALENLPSEPSLDYSKVHGANCEIVVGYVPLPVGIIGPLTLNKESVYIPMATTEGCLVASTNRGAKAISCSVNGAEATILRDGITRAPCLRLPSAMRAAHVSVWCRDANNFAILKEAFESTTSFGKLIGCTPTVAGRNVYVRLECQSGDAMGMNMVSKGSLAVITRLQQEFEDIELVALSGNMCTDKKASATNWLQGRGKSVVVEATIPKKVVQSVLKTTVAAMVHTNIHKNLIGSAMAGVIGGFNAHASNIVTAIFLACGQDPAQNVESSNCITLLEETADGDLWISCTMPSIEVGTVGGGTSLPAQAACLEVLGVRGGHATEPGKNAQQLALMVAAATLAGEMSLIAALAANTLVQAHMKHNRKK